MKLKKLLKIIKYNNIRIMIIKGNTLFKNLLPINVYTFHDNLLNKKIKNLYVEDNILKIEVKNNE